MRIGVYGGTFNPVHSGHVALARHAAEAARLDRVLIIPAALPPHKAVDSLPAPRHRLAMLRLAFPKAPFELCELELQRGGKNYTIDTLTELGALYPGDELFLIIGSDMLLGFEKWRSYREILSMATLVCAARQHGEDEALNEKAAALRAEGGRCLLIDAPPIEVSSTQLRAGDPEAQEHLPAAVADYIAQNALYGRPLCGYPWPTEAVREQLSACLDEKRYLHSLSVAEMAGELAAHYGLPADRAAFAGLVHDAEKCRPRGEQLQILRDSGILIDNTLLHSPGIWHALAAAETLPERFGLLAADILDAVRYHSTGRAAMDTFEKIIFLADLVCRGRHYPEVAAVRSLCFEDLDKATLYCLGFILRKKVAAGEPVFGDTFEAYNAIACTGVGMADIIEREGKR